MGKIEYEKKFIVIKEEDVHVKLNHRERVDLLSILRKLDKGNSYYVCNLDEPYSHRVIAAILDGEKEKKKNLCLCNTCKNEECEGWEGKFTPSSFNVSACKGFVEVNHE